MTSPPVTGATPIYGIEYPIVGEPVHWTRTKLQRNAEKTEAALQARGVAATGASDLLAVSGRVSTLETLTSTKAYATLRGTGTLSLAHNTATALPLTGTEDDPLDGHSTTTNTTRWTCPPNQGGAYLAGGDASFLGNATGRRIVEVRKNGVTLQQAQSALPATAAGTVIHPASPWLYVLVPGDYLEVWATQDSGAALTCQLNYSGLWLARLVKF